MVSKNIPKVSTNYFHDKKINSFIFNLSYYLSNFEIRNGVLCKLNCINPDFVEYENSTPLNEFYNAKFMSIYIKYVSKYKCNPLSY